MNQSNKLIYNRLDYRDTEEFYQAIFQQIRLLLDTKQVFSFHENPKVRGMYVLQFGPSEITNDSTFPVWLTGDEIASVSGYSQLKEYREAKEYVEQFEKSLEDTKEMLNNMEDIDDAFGFDVSKLTKKKKKDDDGGNNDA